MASKKYLELQGLSVESVQEELKQTEIDLGRMKFDHGSKGLENPLTLNETRKDIARLNTELRARELKDMSAEDLAKRSRIRLRRK